MTVHRKVLFALLSLALAGPCGAAVAEEGETEFVPVRYTEHFGCTYLDAPVTMACDLVEREEIKTGVCENRRTRALGTTRLLCYSETKPADLRVACVVDGDVNTSGLSIGEPDAYNDVLCAAIGATKPPVE